MILPEDKKKKKRLGLVIGAGSVMCAASIGLFKVLEENGIGTSLIVGSSAGSLYASLFALGFQTDVIRDYSMNLWTSDLFGGYATNLRSVLSGDSQFTELKGLIDDQPMNDRIKGIYQEYAFADTHLPLYIVTTDLYTGETITLTAGNLFDAIRASIAIPLVFPPWKIGERYFVDGAVSNPLPIDVAIKEGADVIIAMGFQQPTRTRMRSYTAVTNHFNSIYMNNILKTSFAFHNVVHHAEIIPIIPEFDRKISTFDVSQIPDIIEEGINCTRDHVPYILKLLE